MTQQSRIIEQVYSFEENHRFSSVTIAQEMGLPLANVSSVLSKMFRTKCIRRTQQKKQGRHEYWWDKQCRVSQEKADRRVSAAAKEDHLKAARQRQHRPGPSASCDLLISIPVGENETVTLDMKQAKKVHQQLSQIFG